MSWAKKSYRFTKNLSWFSTSTAKYYLPLGPLTTESSSATDLNVQFAPSGPGRIIKIDLVSDASPAPGTTILTLEDAVAGTLGTVSFTYNGSGAVTALNFPEDLDSGTNKFNGLGLIRVSLDVALSASTGQATVTFDIDL